MSLKKKISYAWQSPFKDADGEDIELDLTFKTHDDGDPIFQKKLPNGILVVGYLAHDDDCENPMENCDGMGKLYHASNRDSQEKHDFECAMGLRDPDSEDELDEFHGEAVKIVEQAWRKRNPELDVDNPTTRQAIQSMYHAENVPSDIEGKTWKDLVDRVKENLWKDDNSDPHAVPLDIYEHGGVCYAISNSPEARNFPDQEWDVSHVGACWVPDKCCKEQIIIDAAKICGINIRVIQTQCWAKDEKDRKPWILGIGKNRFSSWEEAGQYARTHIVNKKGESHFCDAERQAARNMAKGVIEEYNKWCNGECYGIVVEWFDADGIQLDNDTCWGFIGDEYAKEEMESSFTSNLGHLAEGRTQEKIVDNCKTFVNPEETTVHA